MNIVDTRANLIRVAKLLEGAKKLEVALGSLNRDDVSIKTLNRGEDVIEIRVAEMGVCLQRVGDTSGGKLERVHGPLEVVVPINPAKRQLNRKYQASVMKDGG